MSIVVEGVAELYDIIGRKVLDYGNIVSPRGLETKELLCESIIINNPRSRLAYNSHRNFSVVYAATEAVLLFSPTKKVRYFAALNSEMNKFSDDGKTLHGAYGNRINEYGKVKDTFKSVVEKLKKDKDSRQASINIYSNEKDAYYDGKDCPCTLSLTFMIRNNKLDMFTHMRSNDIIWGLPYDIFMFTHLQEVIANELGIDVGLYYHIQISLHVYKKHYDLLESMIGNCKEIQTSTHKDILGMECESIMYECAVDMKFGIDKKSAMGLNKYKERTLVSILLNEMLYRNGIKPYIKYPIWATNFVKRWESLE